MNAEIIAVGTELLLGTSTNTDARDVSLALSELGIIVYTDFEECIGGRGRKKKTTKPKK